MPRDANPRNIYSPLNTGRKEFRLLQVQPGSGDDPVKCLLRPASLKSAWRPSYETISYCWGDPTTLSTVEVNGTDIRVPRSSVHAIKRMRRPSQIRTLWIDAICIDQSNLDERSEQVSFMKEIYNQSDGNLVYLGEADDSTQSAIESIGLITEEIKQEFSTFVQFRDTFLPDYYGPVQYSLSGYESDLDLAALDTFFSRPYFQRLWVLPETLVAPSNLCHCGAHELPLMLILRAAAWLRYKSRSLNAPSETSFFNRSLFQWWTVLEWKNAKRQSIFFRIPGELYTFSADREAADPRDRIFALAGLLGGEISKAFVPDYRRPVTEVLRDANRQFFFNRSLLSCWILTEARHTDPAELLSGAQPSWIPTNLDSFSTAIPIPQIFRAHGETSLWSKLSVDQHQAFWNPSHPDELVVPGFAVEEIDQCTSHIRTVCSLADLMEWFVEVETVTGITLSGNVEPERTSLLSTLMCGINFHRNLADRQDTLEGYSFFSFLQRERSFPPNSYLQSLVKEEAASRRYLDCLTLACLGRVFFLTSSGRFGLGPPLTKHGDIVVVLYGSTCPFVLRPVDDEVFKFVGQCYVEGIMFGEAWEAHAAAGGTDESIRIR